ncbi:MAG: ammonium transporter [Leptospiraceae bacterium]|nr:ammonium transporter [Leptospiraceae bacterium]
MWIIFSSGLVFFMQAGFLCLESGLTRTKNSINVAIKNITDFGIATIVFFTIGFGLMYGDSYKGIFGTDYFFPNLLGSSAAVSVFFIFQLMFCGTAATIVSGAVAERMKFGSYIIVTLIISSIIYPIFGHWAWGKTLGEWQTPNGWLGKIGFIDFAGSTVVHSVGGWVGLVAMNIIGPRNGRFGDDGEVKSITGNNLPIAMLGTLILWFGWIGFNGGSTLSFSPRVPGIIANTMLAAAGGMAASLIFGWIRLGYAEATLPLNGALAGLVSITAACNSVSSVKASIIGFVAGILMFEVKVFLEKMKIDDAVGAIPVHLAGGIWGTLAVGIFSDPLIINTGLSQSNQIIVQLIGIFSCAVFSLIISYTILSVVNKFYPIRVSDFKEKQGLNYAEHKATTELTDIFFEMEYQRRTGDLNKNLTVEPFTEVGQIADRYNSVLEKIREIIKEKEILNGLLNRNLLTIQNDLFTAKKIQTAIISEKVHNIQGLTISSRYIPLTEVGGDFFDISEIRTGVTRIFLADSTGHGVQAALITMAIKTLYESFKRGTYSVTEVLFYLNNEFYEYFSNLNQFLTCIILDIDLQKNIITYASAGHPVQFLLNGNEIIPLEKTGRLLGVTQNTGHGYKKISIKEKMKIFLYTDGLSEEWSPTKEEFGEERVKEIFKNTGENPINDIVEQMMYEQERFLEQESRKDDMTIIGIERLF